jgi:very-short-patch-repair endonuclease
MQEPNPPTPFPKKEGGEKPRRLVWNIVRGQQVTADKADRARELRREMTPEEGALWERVRRGGLDYHFRRQQVIRGFIADFYCHQAALVIEVDGPVHELQAEADAHRTVVFESLGIEVLRIRNDEVTNNLSVVLERIRAKCQDRVALTAEPNPPTPFPEKEGGEKSPSGLSPSPLGGGVGEGSPV